MAELLQTTRKYDKSGDQEEDCDLMTDISGDETFMTSRDDNGNMNEATTARHDFEYNWHNKLRCAAVSGPDTIYYKYDPSGNRVRKQWNGGSSVRKYIVDIVGDLPVILTELNGSGGIERTYIHANGRIIAQHAGDHTADRYFYLHDRLGSVRLLIDTSANVKNRYIYDPFGQLHDDSADYEETITNPFKFTGQYFDADIDQYYLRARQYDPPPRPLHLQRPRLRQVRRTAYAT